MLREFLDARTNMKARYVRMYGACDQPGFMDQVINTAWQAGLGVHALIWFGFDNDNAYIARRDSILATMWSNPLAPFVVRALLFGSEPLFDWVLPVPNFAAEVVRAQAVLAGTGIDVTFSEMAWGFMSREKEGTRDLFKMIDVVDAHILPFFSQQASTGDKAWPINMGDMNYFNQWAGTSKIYWAQNGWPSVSYQGVEPNSPNAVASVADEQKYFQLLDSKCTSFKSMGNGNKGVGWFWHIYSDSQAAGYGYYDWNGNPKFSPFQPRIFC